MLKEEFQPIALFSPGEAQSQAFRIPALIQTKKGTLIAAGDARLASQRDNPNEIKNVIRRSFDEGTTWGDYQTTVEYFGDPGLNGPAALDCALLQDEVTQRIWSLYCHTPGGVGAFSSWAGRGFDEKGRKILYNRHLYPYVLAEDGTVYTKDDETFTDYTVNQTGQVFKNGEKLGSIYDKLDETKERYLYETPTSYLQLIYSDDEGATWSKPIDLNLQVKEEWMSFIGAGPGIGIQLTKGTNQGRLLFPIYFMNRAGFFSCSVIYSDDHGQTWQRGASPNDQRPIELKAISAESLGQELKRYELTESQLFEKADGTLVVYMRNHFEQGCVAKAESLDGGVTWQALTFVPALVNPVCQFSLLTYPALLPAGQDALLFLGPNSTTKREEGLLRISLDEGQTWPIAKEIASGSFIYSSMTRLKEGKIGILYETQLEKDGLIRLMFTKVAIDGLL